jgi:hypothetical protein
VVEVCESEAPTLIEALWELSPRRGAISAAGKIQHALVSRAAIVALDNHETAALIAARGR